jgi:hypothetical protein
MDYVGNLTGCSLSVSSNAVSATISCTAGAVHFANGVTHNVIPHAISVTPGDRPRRVRVYFTGIYPGTPQPLGHGLGSMVIGGTKGQGNIGIDDDQSTSRGVYPGGLVVLGHVEIPAKSMSTTDNSSDGKTLGTRERNNLLRVIRALADMNQLPSKGYAESIRTKLDTLGLSAPSDDTIRKAIEDARDLDS